MVKLFVMEALSLPIVMRLLVGRIKVIINMMYPYNNIHFDISLARGLSYYTGCIFEVEATDVKIGSIGGGGRYDDLTGSFGLKDVSGVGISFGAARIYDVMEELELFPESVSQVLKLLVLSFDEASNAFAFELVSQLRANGISSDLYPEPAKMKKQMKYADKIKVPYVLLIGSNEMESGEFSLKNMLTGEQENCSVEDLINRFS